MYPVFMLNIGNKVSLVPQRLTAGNSASSQRTASDTASDAGRSLALAEHPPALLSRS